jgi:hypothetical protein
MNSSPRFPLVIVSGVGHSGSTLLGSLLNAHREVACVGEMTRMASAREKGIVCGCRTAIEECEFWKPLLPLLAGKGEYDWRDMTPEVYERVRRHAGTPVLVDLSKTIAWRMAKPRRSPWRRAKVGYLWLVRDSRGVMASSYRQGKPVGAKLARHLKWIERWEKFMPACGEQGITVFYEDLCADPHRELARICDWMGIDFDEGMFRPGDQPQHFIHSNPLDYLGAGNEIRLDERWHDELPAGVRAEIEACMRRSPFLRTRYLT